MKAHTPAQLRTLDDAVDFLYQVAQQPHGHTPPPLPAVPAGVEVEHVNDKRDYCSLHTEYLTLILNVFVNPFNMSDKTNISVYPKHGTADKTLAKNVVNHLKAGGRFSSMGPKRLIWEC